MQSKEKCCGCMACVNACPVDAIAERDDDNGFVYPCIDKDNCVNCGLRERVCAWTKPKEETLNVLSAYALRYKDEDTLMKSTSGGAFTALAEEVLRQRGYVVGASWEGLELRHVVIEERGEMDKIRGTKYVQSGIGFVFKKVKELLEANRQVIFVGTPCQVAGLKSFLRHPYTNLLLVDFLCHGVPNNEFLKAHVRYIEQLKHKKVERYLFRDKKYGWNSSGIEGVVYAGGRKAFSYETQAYNKFFYSNVSLRPSCLDCRYRSQHRNSDITIADFWGVEKVLGRQDDKGMSLVFVNSERGKAAFSKIGTNCEIKSVPLEKVLYRIPTKPARSKYDADKFWALYREKGYAAVVKKYAPSTLKARLRFFLKKGKRRFSI